MMIKEFIILIIQKITEIGFLIIVIIMAIIKAVVVAIITIASGLIKKCIKIGKNIGERLKDNYKSVAKLFFKNRFLAKISYFIKNDKTSVWLICVQKI